jgi:predicted  nucleic acid-binding Zn-ribbon protein
MLDLAKDYSFLLQERDRWVARKKELESEISKIDQEDSRLRGELEKIREQAAYYESLTRDMKRELQPSSVSGMLKSM